MQTKQKTRKRHTSQCRYMCWRHVWLSNSTVLFDCAVLALLLLTAAKKSKRTPRHTPHGDEWGVSCLFHIHCIFIEQPCSLVWSWKMKKSPRGYCCRCRHYNVPYSCRYAETRPSTRSKTIATLQECSFSKSSSSKVSSGLPSDYKKPTPENNPKQYVLSVCVRACVHACVRPCVHACVRACISVCVPMASLKCWLVCLYAAVYVWKFPSLLSGDWLYGQNINS